MDSMLRSKSRSSGSSRNKSTFRSKSGLRSGKIAQITGSSFPETRINSTEWMQSLESYNPTLKSILKVEDIFQKQGEFDSRSQLIRELGGSMKIQVLDVILKYLKSLGKVLDNNDGSWTWIFVKHNETLKKSWEKADQL